MVYVVAEVKNTSIIIDVLGSEIDYMVCSMKNKPRHELKQELKDCNKLISNIEYMIMSGISSYDEIKKILLCHLCMMYVLNDEPLKVVSEEEYKLHNPEEIKDNGPILLPPMDQKE